jgi:hypothetical protein
MVWVGIVAVALVLMGCYTAGETKQSVETPPVQSESQATSEPAQSQANAAAPETHGEGVEEGAHGQSQGDVEMPHMHGLGFSTDGRQLFVAAHDGLRVFADGVWLVPDLPAHDYMGYVATDNGFYSSGHPHPSANMINPFGLVKSSDGGKTLTKLGFEGESDFHLMGVGYQNHAIYVLNLSPNSKLSQVGIYYSLDDGQTWQQSAAQGLTSQPIQLAVHPTEANGVAIATETGLFLSTDYGNTFELVSEGGLVTAATFNPDGASLFFGFQELFVYDMANKQILDLSAPVIATEDAITYIAVSPARIEDIALATYQRDMYLSKDGGSSWQQIAQAGKGIAMKN